MMSLTSKLAGRLVVQPSRVISGTIRTWPCLSMLRSIRRSTRRTGRWLPSMATACSHRVTRLPARGLCHCVAPSPSRRAANAAASVLRGFHLMSQSTCGMPVRLQASISRIRRTESKPESSRARIGALGPCADRRWAIGMTRCRLKSVSLAECCTPGRSASSRQNPCEPR